MTATQRPTFQRRLVRFSYDPLHLSPLRFSFTDIVDHLDCIIFVITQVLARRRVPHPDRPRGRLKARWRTAGKSCGLNDPAPIQYATLVNQFRPRRLERIIQHPKPKSGRMVMQRLRNSLRLGGRDPAFRRAAGHCALGVMGRA